MRPSLIAGLLLLVSGATVIGAPTASRPNVIVILTDDHGWADLGANASNRGVKTPNMDALAADGVRFERGYVSAPVCVASRAGLLTGRYQTRFGIETNADGPLPAAEKTIGDRMRAAGYVTGLVGKWHVASSPANSAGAKAIPAREILWGDNARITDPNLPGKRGFDEYYYGAIRNYAVNFDLQGNLLPNAPVLVNDSGFRIDLQTEAALAFIKRQQAKPFFLYLAYFAPHVPLEAPEKYLARFPDVKDPVRRKALAMISAMDDGIGRIRDLLRERELERNTLIIFLSDNGAPLKPGMWDGSLNDPLLGEKGMLTDGGHRLPFVMAWPGTLPAGKVYTHPVISLDIMPTALAAAGAETRPEWKLDGVNLLPFLKEARTEAPHRELFWRFNSQAAVLTDRWKLLYLAPDRWMLFDTRSPEGESSDVAARHPEVLAELQPRLRAWAAEQSPAGLPTKMSDEDAEFYHRNLHLELGR
ncbi:MAG: sulfatase-like hydrolase/transferase [Lacunisphaera sp.]